MPLVVTEPPIVKHQAYCSKLLFLSWYKWLVESFEEYVLTHGDSNI